MQVLISGAGIAGLTLGYWLDRRGHDVTIVETAPQLRTGGYIIDFWGTGFDVAEKMDIVPQLMKRGYRLREVRLVDDDGRKVGGFAADVFARMTKDRYVSLPRGDLASALFSALPDSVTMIFNDELVGLQSEGTTTSVRFRSGRVDRFDLVFGAGGLHSRVRSLAFGQERLFAHYLGYKAAAFEVAGYAPRDELVYVAHARPGVQAARFSLRDGSTVFLLVVADSNEDIPHAMDARKAYLHRHFDGAGWECPQIMSALDAAGTLYFDNVTQIEMPRWVNERVALVGDAAFCPSLLAGEGSSLAMMAAYVLAGELGAGRNVERAFGRYQRTLWDFMQAKQRAARNFATAFAPRTWFGIGLRNLVTKTMAIPQIANFAIGQSVRDDIVLPNY